MSRHPCLCNFIAEIVNGTSQVTIFERWFVDRHRSSTTSAYLRTTCSRAAQANLARDIRAAAEPTGRRVAASVLRPMHAQASGIGRYCYQNPADTSGVIRMILRSHDIAPVHPSSAARPASVTHTRTTSTGRSPAFTASGCAVASPSRTRSATISILNPCANKSSSGQLAMQRRAIRARSRALL